MENYIQEGTAKIYISEQKQTKDGSTV